MAGLLLAAGAGRRMGGPKALVSLDGEPLVRRAWRALGAAGLATRVVVLGAAHEDVAAVLPAGAATVLAEGWEQGMGASLRAGLAALRDREDVDVALVSLVDTPGIGPDALRRVATDGLAPRPCDSLARGAFGGRPGHPVLLGRAHWAAVEAVAHGDAGARDYLRGHPALTLVEIGDLADPGDVDTPSDLDRIRGSGPAVGQDTTDHTHDHTHDRGRS